MSNYMSSTKPSKRNSLISIGSILKGGNSSILNL